MTDLSRIPEYPERMTPDRILFSGGIVLLAVAALLGFVQQRHRRDREAHERWRVVHNGGTAGAVQLLALAAVFDHMSAGLWTSFVLLGVQFSTWAFFLGPLAQALKLLRMARGILVVGGVAALPSYGCLPLLLLA